MKRSSHRALAVIALTTACNDGSEGGSAFGDVTGPLVVLTFPPSVSFTDAETIIATGTASDASGVAEVRVNGVLATTSDGFVTWHASVPLVAGANALTVTATDSLGNSDARAAEARIESQALLLRPWWIAVDPARQLAFVLDGGLKAVDLLTGVRTTVSDHAHGTGPRLFGAGLALDGDRALVLNNSPQSVLAVDLASGDRTILSDASHGAGPIHFWQAIAVDGGRALVTSAHLSAVLAVDLASGDRTILSGPSAGSGPGFRNPVGIVVDGERALVLDSHLHALLAVDLATGDRTVLSDASTGSGPAFTSPQLGLTLDEGRALVADSGLGAVLAVDLVIGDRTILSDPKGSPIVSFGIAVDGSDGTRALLTEANLGAVLAMDLSSGELTALSPRTSVGSGPAFSAGGIALDEGRALLGGREAFLVAVDFATGERTVVSDGFTGGGRPFAGVEALVVDGGRALVVAHHAFAPGESGIFAVDLASGDRSLVSSFERGLGPAFEDLEDIALDGSRVIVTDSESGGVFGVDLASGDRTILPGFRWSGGTGFPTGIVVDGDRAIVIENDDSDSILWGVDLASGAQTILAFSEVGEGPGWKDLIDLVLDGDRILVGRSIGIYAADLATGNRSIFSDVATPVGSGPVISPEQFARSGDRLWVTNPYLEAVMAVDLRFGQRVIVAR